MLRREAVELGITLEAHYAHLLVHGTLHAQGWDHETSEQDAEEMEAREIEILRLIGDGLDTAEIATTLSYSERTVKNVLHDVTSRLQLRNRSHAVAYALKQGMI